MAACLLLASITAAAGENPWEPRLEKNGILVETRPEPGSPFRWFRAVTIVNAPLAATLALLEDTAACTRWVYNCIESTLVEQISPVERVFYQVTDLPFPLRSRDAIFHARVDFNADVVRVTLTARPDALPGTRKVRITDARGFYELEAVDKGLTRVTWQQFVDPGGSVPAWLVNAMLTDLPYESLLNFRRLAAQPPYSQATFKRDEQGNPVSLRQPGGSGPAG